MSTATESHSSAAGTPLAGLTAGTWNVDPSHSTVGFVARHLMITKVRGRFADFGGEVVLGDDATASTLQATVQMASVDTGDEGRDVHLRGADFFDVEQYPTMTLQSSAVRTHGGDYALEGELTIKGVSKPVSFELDFDGVNIDPWSNTKAAFTARTVINRRDWGLEWNVSLDSGGVLVGEKIAVELEIQLVKA